MNKRTIILIVVLLAMTVSTMGVWADEFIDNVPRDSHKIRNKFDYSGAFTGLAGYSCPGTDSSPLWTFKVHVKEAMDADYSKGTVHFATINSLGEEIDIIGQVETTVTSFSYSSWAGFGNLLGAAGTATYNGTPYYFMVLSDEKAVWFALSTTSYDGYWGVPGTMVWPSGLRYCQAHSPVTTPGTYPLDYKIIHTE